MIAASVLTVATAPFRLSYGLALLIGVSAASCLLGLEYSWRRRKEGRRLNAAPAAAGLSHQGYRAIPKASRRGGDKRHAGRPWPPAFAPVFDASRLGRIAQDGPTMALVKPPAEQARPHAKPVQAALREHVSRMRVLVCAFEPRLSALVEADADSYSAFWPVTTRATFTSSTQFLNALAEGVDVVHLLGEVADNQHIIGLGYSGETLIQECAAAGVKLLWMASDNDPQVYIDGFHTRGRAMNLIMTLQRHGPLFRAFLNKLLARMCAGEALGQAWVQLCPQGVPGPSEPDAPGAIFAMGAPDWPVPRGARV